MNEFVIYLHDNPPCVKKRVSKVRKKRYNISEWPRAYPRPPPVSERRNQKEGRERYRGDGNVDKSTVLDSPEICGKVRGQKFQDGLAERTRIVG